MTFLTPGRRLRVLLKGVLPCLLFAVWTAHAAPVERVASDAFVSYMGRVQRDGEAVHQAYPGIETTVRFRGASLRLEGRLEGDFNAFNREVDGAPAPRLEMRDGPFQLTLAEGLDPEAEHTVRLVRRNEAWQGVVTLERFLLPEGGEFLPVEASVAERRLLCIGDSITSGDHIDFLPPYAADGPQTWNAEQTYGWLLAKRFGAAVHLVSYGGRGVVRDWQGKTGELPAIDFLERTLPDEPTSVWDPSAYQPDLVTICLGTNDYGAGMLDEAVFVAGYVALVERVRALYPAAKVLLISSPMLPGYAPDRATAVERALVAVQAHFRAAGEEFIGVHFLPDYAGTSWNAHPVAPQHAAMAEELAASVRRLTGWKRVTSSVGGS